MLKWVNFRGPLVIHESVFYCTTYIRLLLSTLYDKKVLCFRASAESWSAPWRSPAGWQKPRQRSHLPDIDTYISYTETALTLPQEKLNRPWGLTFYGALITIINIMLHIFFSHNLQDSISSTLMRPSRSCFTTRVRELLFLDLWRLCHHPYVLPTGCKDFASCRQYKRKGRRKRTLRVKRPERGPGDQTLDAHFFFIEKKRLLHVVKCCKATFVVFTPVTSPILVFGLLFCPLQLVLSLSRNDRNNLAFFSDPDTGGEGEVSEWRRDHGKDEEDIQAESTLRSALGWSFTPHI